MSRRRLLLLLVVAWCGMAAALEGYRTVRLYVNRPWNEAQPSQWRLGSDPAVRMRAFLDSVDAQLPAPARLVFTSSLGGEEGHILHMWAAYLLPRHDVVPLSAPGSEQAQYWLVYGPPGAAPEPPDGSALIFATANGSLWQLSSAGRGDTEPVP